MKLYACHQLFFPTLDSLHQYLGIHGQRQVQDLRNPHMAYRRVTIYSKQYYQGRDVRARRVRWRLCEFELPTDLRWLQPLGDSPDNELQPLMEPVKINFAPPYVSRQRRSYGPFMDWIEDRKEVAVRELRWLFLV